MLCGRKWACTLTFKPKTADWLTFISAVWLAVRYFHIESKMPGVYYSCWHRFYQDPVSSPTWPQQQKEGLCFVCPVQKTIRIHEKQHWSCSGGPWCNYTSLKTRCGVLLQPVTLLCLNILSCISSNWCELPPGQECSALCAWFRVSLFRVVNLVSAGTDWQTLTGVLRGDSVWTETPHRPLTADSSVWGPEY